MWSRFEVGAMPPLRLAVDARVIAEDTRGIGRYARAILRRLATRDDIALTLLVDGILPQRRRAAYAASLGCDEFLIRGSAGRQDDLLWHPANGTFFASRLPNVATIHDAVPFRYPNSDAKRRAHAQRPFLRSAANATRIIAVSKFGRSELHDALGIPLDRITVIEHGVEGSFSPGDPAPLPTALAARAFLLFVGDPIGEPRKNFTLLYEAYRRAWPAGDGPPLTVAGPRAPELPGVLWAGNLGDDLVAGGDEVIRACYRAGVALTLPSYHETFGMPMLEAMACGMPVLAARAGSLPEIGGDAALFLPFNDADAWATALRQIVADPALRERLRVQGLERVSHFSWDESARRHVALFREVAG